MINKNKEKIIYFVGVLFSLTLFAMFIFKENKENLRFADSADPNLLGELSGYAYSENFGWISFNCNNDSSCGTANYKVNLYKTYLEGYAYSEQLGWIKIDPSVGGGVLYNEITGLISGNAYSENAGWIKFDISGSQALLNKTTNEIEKFAYGENVGWISFNCNNDSSCGTVDYKVKLVKNIPIIDSSSLEVKISNYDEVCQYKDARRITFIFDVDDKGLNLSEYKYRLKILRTDNTLAYQEENNLNLAHKVVVVDKNKFSDTNKIDYDTNYKWSVELVDKNNVALEEVAGADYFITYEKEFPNPDNFTWHSPDPSAKEEIKFTSADLAKYYPSANNSETACNDSECSWKWDLSDYASASFKTGYDGNASTTVVVYNKAGADMGGIKLTLTDPDTSYYCSTSTKMKVKEKLPTWRESR